VVKSNFLSDLRIWLDAKPTSGSEHLSFTCRTLLSLPIDHGEVYNTLGDHRVGPTGEIPKRSHLDPQYLLEQLALILALCR